MNEGQVIDDEPIEIVAGRRAPFTQLADWVALSGVSDHAKALYWHLKMHVNVERGDAEVWPGKEVLAHWMKLSRGSKIDPYLKELVALGAIEIIRRRYSNGLRTRNRYVIHDLPPEGYEGPTSLAEWYARHPEYTSGGNSKTAGQPVVPSTGPRSHASTCPEGKTAGQPVVPSGGPRSPLQGTPVVPSRGVEQDEVQLENPPPPRPPKSQSPHEHETQGEGGAATPDTGQFPSVDGGTLSPPTAESSEPLSPPADDPVIGVARNLLASLPAPVTPGERTTRDLAPLVVEAVAAGWSCEALSAHLTADLPSRVRSVRALLRHRLEDLPAAPSVSVASGPVYGPRCGDSRHDQAAPQYDRWLYEGGRIVGKCECALPVADGAVSA